MKCLALLLVAPAVTAFSISRADFLKTAVTLPLATTLLPDTAVASTWDPHSDFLVGALMYPCKLFLIHSLDPLPPARQALTVYIYVPASPGPEKNAISDYELVPTQQRVGSDNGKIDVNNAYVTQYKNLPGMYPHAAGLIASNGPYKSVKDLMNIPSASNRDKELFQKYRAELVALPPGRQFYERINAYASTRHRILRERRVRGMLVAAR